MEVEITTVSDEITRSAGISLCILRLDLLHPITGGNKIFKLRYLIDKYGDMPESTKPLLLGFGGYYSNAIAALARFGKENHFRTAAIIRGQKPAKKNLTLSRAEKDGMKLHFVSRQLYSDKAMAAEEIISHYEDKNIELIPQGVASFNGYLGCKQILAGINPEYDYVICDSATGTTLAGLRASSPDRIQCIGIAVLKNKREQLDNLKDFLMADGIHAAEVELMEDYHGGGFAKQSPALIEFISWFNDRHPDVPVEKVYSGKMMYGIYDLANKGYFKSGSSLLAVHSGGLQYLLQE